MKVGGFQFRQTRWELMCDLTNLRDKFWHCLVRKYCSVIFQVFLHLHTAVVLFQATWWGACWPLNTTSRCLAFLGDSSKPEIQAKLMNPTFLRVCTWWTSWQAPWRGFQTSGLCVRSQDAMRRSSHPYLKQWWTIPITFPLRKQTVFPSIWNNLALTKQHSYDLFVRNLSEILSRWAHFLEETQTLILLSARSDFASHLRKDLLHKFLWYFYCFCLLVLNPRGIYLKGFVSLPKPEIQSWFFLEADEKQLILVFPFRCKGHIWKVRQKSLRLQSCAWKFSPFNRRPNSFACRIKYSLLSEYCRKPTSPL